MELGSCGKFSLRGCLLAAVTHVCALDYVAKMLGEHSELLKAIV
jgi:hypothetical protein